MDQRCASLLGGFHPAVGQDCGNPKASVELENSLPSSLMRLLAGSRKLASRLTHIGADSGHAHMGVAQFLAAWASPRATRVFL